MANADGLPLTKIQIPNRKIKRFEIDFVSILYLSSKEDIKRMKIGMDTAAISGKSGVFFLVVQQHLECNISTLKWKFLPVDRNFLKSVFTVQIYGMSTPAV